MRKHLLRILTLVFVVCFGACLFAACGDGEGENPDEQPATYTLTYNANGGTGADVTESHAEGDKVILKAANTFTNSGYTFKAWNDGTKDYGAGEEFTMPASNVTLKAQWTKNQDTPPAPTTYKVTVTGDHVTATFDAQGPYAEGTTVKFTLAIDSGFELVSVKNGDADVEKGTDNKYFVVVGKADIAITVTTKSMTPTPVAKHSVTVGGEHVTATFDEEGPYAEGTTVKFTLAIDSGFELVSVKNGDADVEKGTDNKYFVVVGKADIVITVETEAIKYTVTVTGNGVTATFDEDGPYVMGTTVKFTLEVEDDDYMVESVKNGDEDVEKGADGKYSVVVGTANISITVTTMEKAKGQLADEANYSVRFGGRQDAIGHENGFLLWWVQDVGWYCGDVVELTPNADNIASAVENGKLSFQYKGGNRNYSVQLFYYNNHLRAAEYYLTLNIKSNVDLSIIVNGEPVELKAGTETPVEVRFTNSLTYEQATYALDIQFPGTTESTEADNPNAGVELGDAENVGIEISDVEWYCVKGTEDETMPYEEAPSYKATDVSLKESDGKVYLVLSGTYKNYDSDEVFRAYLNKFYKDLQVNGFIADGNKWLNQTEWTEFKDLPVKVTAADGEWTYEIEVSSLENHPYQLHFGPIKGDLFIADTSMSGEYLISGDKKFTIHNRLGHGSSEAHEFYGLIGLTIEAYDTETKTVSFRTAEIKADGNTPYLVVYLFTTGYTDAEIKTFKLFDGDKAELTVNESKSTIKANDESILYFDLSAMEKEDGYYGHLKIGDEPWTGQENGNIKPVGTVSTEVQIINYRNYNVKYDDYGQLVVVVSDVLNFLEASLKTESGKVYYILKVHFTDKDLDAMKTAVLYDGEKTFNVVQDKVAAIEGTEHDFVLYFDVTAAAKGEFWPHLKFGETPWNGADGNGDVRCTISETENTAETDIKTYTLEDGWGMPKLVVEDKPLEEPTFTFDKNGAGAGDDPEIELGGTEGGVYNVTLPENSFTAPDNKYFRGWEIDGVVYFPGEKAEVEPGSTVTLKAIWEELYAAYEQDVTISHTWTGAVNVIVANGAPAAELTATVSDSATLVAATDAWHGILVDINMTIKGATAANFIRLRVDGFIFAFTADDANIAQIGKDTSKWDAEKYVALFANGGKAVQRVTASLSGRVLTYTIATYAAGTTDFTTAEPVVSVTYTVESAIDVAALTLAFYHDDGVTKVDGVDQPNNTFKLENAKVKNYISYSTNQAPTAENPITVGTSDNAMAYSGNAPAWTSTLKKGEKVVLKGTMTSAANATTAGNYMAMLAYLYSGNAPVAAIRSDNYIVEGDAMLNAEGLAVEMAPTIQDETKHAASEIKDDTAFWACMRAIIANCTAEMTFDYTDASKIVITIVYTGDDNKFTQTYTFTAKEGQALKDEYKIGVGGDHNYTVLTSLVRSSVKAAD